VPLKTVLKPVGRVVKGAVVIQKRWVRGLEGLEGFSHIILLGWLDRAHEPVMKVRPKGIKRFPKVGFIATRTPHRPNPVGMTVVKLLKRRGGRLCVKGLDFRNGTPIIDIKPYTRKDAISGFRMPGWVKRLDGLETDPLRKYAS
jgi:tRNA-Thr(GGU) m(6)t(6)A37 methyltransferase TsaA